jgi:hypothetical protein
VEETMDGRVPKVWLSTANGITQSLHQTNYAKRLLPDGP